MLTCNAKNKHFYYSILLITFLYLFDLGNINAIRQSTEGFYLQIGKEMFAQKSLLTPLYEGRGHWSKPPIMFWMSYAISFIYGSTNLFILRLSNCLLGIISIAYISIWLKRNFDVEKNLTAFFFASSLCFVKYSRIYMMEIPLAIFCFIAILKFYDALVSNKNSDLLLSSIFLACGTMVKGPISLVMFFGGAGLFCLYSYRYGNKKYFKKIVLLMIASTFLSSIWFVLSYVQHGDKFINEFFIKQNAGKFIGNKYPMRSVVQGLLIYALPATFFIPIFLGRFIKVLEKYQAPSAKQKFILYLTCFFLSFYLIWFIPTTRSHHYAVPAIPIFFSIMLLTIDGISPLKFTSFKVTKKFMIGTSGVFLILLTIIIAKLNLVFEVKQIFSIVLGMAFLVAALIIFWKTTKLKHFFIAFLLFLHAVWVCIFPVLSFPLIPKSLQNYSFAGKISTTNTRYYFIAENLQKEVSFISEGQKQEFLQGDSKYLITSKEIYLRTFKDNTILVKSWDRWKRKVTFREVIKAIFIENLKSIQYEMVLLEKKR